MQHRFDKIYRFAARSHDKYKSACRGFFVTTQSVRFMTHILCNNPVNKKTVVEFTGGKGMKIDKETVIIICIMAIMGAIGIVSLCGAVLGISFAKLGLATVLGLVLGTAGLIFGVLVIANTKC